MQYVTVIKGKVLNLNNIDSHRQWLERQIIPGRLVKKALIHNITPMFVTNVTISPIGLINNSHCAEQELNRHSVWPFLETPI